MDQPVAAYHWTHADNLWYNCNKRFGYAISLTDVLSWLLWPLESVLFSFVEKWNGMVNHNEVYLRIDQMGTN